MQTVYSDTAPLALRDFSGEGASEDIPGEDDDGSGANFDSREKVVLRRFLDPQTHQLHLIKAKPRGPPEKRAGAEPGPSGAKASGLRGGERRNQQALRGRRRGTGTSGDVGVGMNGTGSSTATRKAGSGDRLSTTSEPSPDVPVSPRTVRLMLSQIGSTRIG